MLTATGVGSGLDIDGLVRQLVAAERDPVANRLLSREANITAEISAFGTLQGSLSSFRSSLDSLTGLSNFGQRTASSSNSEILTATANSEAAAGSYEVAVTQLAKAHSLASGSFSSSTDEVGTGTITIRFGTTDYTAPDPDAIPAVSESYDGFSVNADRGVATITIDSSNNTLEGVRDAINGADAGVSAVIVNDGSGSRLVISSDATGEENSLEISVADEDGNNTDELGLSRLAFSSDATNLAQTVDAQDALFSINGLSVSSGDNQAADVIEGVELSLLGVTEIAPVTVTVAEDKASVRSAIDDFVKSYNSLVTTVANLTRYDAETEQAGPLQGDFSARSVSSQLRQLITGVVEGFDGPFTSLTEIGITSSVDGTLTVDSGRLGDVLNENFDDLVGLFAAFGRPTDANVEFLSSSGATQVGNYAVEITQLATQGVLQGAAISSLVVDASNDTFAITVDGTASETITLTQGTYSSGVELAAELQSRINGDSNLSETGIAVQVNYDATNNRFEITSPNYGSSSVAEITSVDATTAATLGLSAVAGTAGVDVAGTIGGFAATGTGRILSGQEGSITEGLRLSITGDTTGSRGTVSFSKGIAYQLDHLIDQFLGSNGLLDARTDGLQAGIEDIEAEREVLDRRIEALEGRLFRQFNALDGLLAQLQSTSDFLTQQLANLPEPGLLINGNN